MRSSDISVLLKSFCNLLTALIFALGVVISGGPVIAGSLKSRDALERIEAKRILQRAVKDKVPSAPRALEALQRIFKDKPPGTPRALETLDAGGLAKERAGRRAFRSGGGQITMRIVNGVGTFRYAAAGALLKGSDAKSASPWCSGTLIGCSTFLTAAHCFDDNIETPNMDSAPDPNNYKVFFQSGGVYDVQEIHLHNSYNFPDADVAVLKLARPVEGIVPLQVNQTEKPPSGTEGIIVGFGRTGGFNQDYGIKRIGAVKTSSCTGGFSNSTLVCWDFDSQISIPGEDSNTCEGDSGGGLYVGDDLIVAGVTSGGIRSSCQAGDHSYDANVFRFKSWIETVSAGDLSANACGSLPIIDEDQHVMGAIEVMSEAAPEASFTVDVPLNISKFRVAMNGEDNGLGRNNFDLYLIPGNTTDTDQAKCIENGTGQFGFCDVDNPLPGPWTALVRRKKGEGLVQITVTLLPNSS